MPQRDPAKERYWRRLLRQWRRSGLSLREFCVDQGISQPSFYAWRRAIARRDDETATKHKATRSTGELLPRQLGSVGPAFIKLAIDADTTLAPAIEIVLSERRLLRVRPGFDADLLRQLVRLLEEPSC